MSLLWQEERPIYYRFTLFFLISFAEEDIESYYKTNFILHQYYHWTLEEIENLYPFELTIYTALTIQYQREREQLLQKYQN